MSAVQKSERQGRPGRGRPAQLSREMIVAAALESNIDTLTVRELATRLGVSHGALYRWVSSRDQLLDLVSEVIVDRVMPDHDPRPNQWQPWLRQLAWAMHDEFLAVPGYATRTARPIGTARRGELVRFPNDPRAIDDLTK